MTTTAALGVTIIGGGIMGRGIALALAAAGHEISIVEADAAVAESIAEHLDADARANIGMNEETPLAALARVTLAADFDTAIASAGLVIEAVPEQMVIKQPIWARLGRACSPTTVLATNTSALDVDALASQVAHPERILGTHWFNPAQVVPCVEIVRGAETSQDAIDFVVGILTQAGKVPVVVKNSPWVRRQSDPVRARARSTALPGRRPSVRGGHRFHRKFVVRRPAGGARAFGQCRPRRPRHLPIILDFLSSQLGERFAVPPVLDALVAAGRLGVKTGNGIGEYSATEARRLMAYRDTTLRRVISAVNDEDGGGR